MRRGEALWILLLAMPLAACSSDHLLVSITHPVLVDSFDGFVNGTWEEGETYGPWTTVYNGYGEVGIVDGALMTSPQPSRRPEETHAALVATTEWFEDIEIEATITTVDQLRTGSEPNPWETGWLVWNYTRDTSFYYVALKTNGWELGKADANYPGAQRFLADARDRAFAVGQSVHLRVRQVGDTIAVWIDGDFIGSWVDREDPLYEGAVALYNEDATVMFDDIVVSTFD
jgi:hypothetical protein